MEDWLKYLVCFILGWIIARMMGEGFSVGCVEIPHLSQIEPEDKQSLINSLNNIMEMNNYEFYKLHTDVKSKLHHLQFKNMFEKAAEYLDKIQIFSNNSETKIEALRKLINVMKRVILLLRHYNN